MYRTNKPIPAGTCSRAGKPSPSAVSSNAFLHGAVICLLPLKLHNGRMKLLQQRLVEAGAVIVVFDVVSFPDCTHLLVEEKVVFDELFEVLAGVSLLNLKELVGKVSFVRIQWASRCLSGKSKHPESEFSINAQFLILIDGRLEKAKGVKRNHSPDRFFNDAPASASMVISPKSGSTENKNSAEKKKLRVQSDVSSYESSADAASDASGSDADDTVSPVAARYLNKYVCSAASSSKAQNLNGHITGPLEELAGAYKNNGEVFRNMAYGKVISMLKNHPKRIVKAEELNGFRNVGTNIRNKIAEILETGACQKVEEICQDNEVNQAVNLFCNIHGVSSKTATKWAALNLRTLDDLKSTVKLNTQQLIGVKHYHDFIERIPREEVVEIENTVREAAVQLQAGLTLTTCGSYRRGRPTCGDVDILISHPDGKSHRSIFSPLLQHLHSTGFLIDDLSIGEDGTQKKYLGVCRLPGENRKHRRLDIICVPYNELACALLYFTGSAHFNRSMRSYAHRLHMALSHHSLNKNVVRVKREKVHDGEVIPTPTELSIFEQLGMTYLEPADRDH